MTLNAELVDKLLKVETYREFIGTFKHEVSKDRPFSYTQLARRAGFAARSFPRDVVNGQKRLTASSLDAMIFGMGIKGDLAEYFRVLVLLEHPDISTPRRSEVLLYKRKALLKERLTKRTNHFLASEDIFLAARAPLIFAACGEIEKGVTIEDLEEKTQLPRSEIELCLEKLASLGMIVKNKKRFHPTSSHFHFDHFGKSKGLQTFFLHLLDQAAKKARSNFSSQNNLYFASHFSVHPEKLPALKRELSEVMVKYIDESESGTGSHIASVVCALI